MVSSLVGGLASLGIIKHNLAPALIGKDPLDHAVMLDTLLHTWLYADTKPPHP